MIDTPKSRQILRKDLDQIINTNYGLREIPACFGYMNIQNPFDMESRGFSNPDEFELAKRDFTLRVREALQQTGQCTKCHLLEKCVQVSQLMLLKNGNK